MRGASLQQPLHAREYLSAKTVWLIELGVERTDLQLLSIDSAWNSTLLGSYAIPTRPEERMEVNTWKSPEREND